MTNRLTPVIDGDGALTTWADLRVAKGVLDDPKRRRDVMDRATEILDRAAAAAFPGRIPEERPALPFPLLDGPRDDGPTRTSPAGARVSVEVILSGPIRGNHWWHRSLTEAVDDALSPEPQHADAVTVWLDWRATVARHRAADADAVTESLADALARRVAQIHAIRTYAFVDVQQLENANRSTVDLENTLTLWTEGRATAAGRQRGPTPIHSDWTIQKCVGLTLQPTTTGNATSLAPRATRRMAVSTLRATAPRKGRPRTLSPGDAATTSHESLIIDALAGGVDTWVEAIDAVVEQIRSLPAVEIRSGDVQIVRAAIEELDRDVSADPGPLAPGKDLHQRIRMWTIQTAGIAGDRAAATVARLNAVWGAKSTIGHLVLSHVETIALTTCPDRWADHGGRPTTDPRGGDGGPAWLHTDLHEAYVEALAGYITDHTAALRLPRNVPAPAPRSRAREQLLVRHRHEQAALAAHRIICRGDEPAVNSAMDGAKDWPNELSGKTLGQMFHGLIWIDAVTPRGQARACPCGAPVP